MAPKPQPNAAGADSPSLTAAATSSKEGSEAPTPSKQSRNTSPLSTVGIAPPNKSDPETASGKGTSASQPMTTSSSTSSASTPADAKDAATGPSPYGTRSRNRNGRARPNYAEDRDIDVDLLDGYADRKDDGESKKSAKQVVSSTNATQDAPRSGTVSSRKPLPTSTDEGKHGGAVSKDQHQHNAGNPSAAALSSSAASSVNAPPASKKRKQAGTSTSSATQNQATATATATAHATPSSNAAQRKPCSGATGYPETNMMSFENCKGRPKNGILTADDGSLLAVNDHVYLICEPPGEPYYIGRIMEFLHTKNDMTMPVDSIRVNWFYRPKDMGRKSQDTRMLFATMHSDISPLNTLRGKCTVRHKAEITNVDEYRKSPDCFWWDKMYDRYIQKNYDAIPTSQIINVPERVKKVLDERWKYVLVEQGRGKELTSAVKSCKRCNGYCARAAERKASAQAGQGQSSRPERKLEALNAPHLHDRGSHVSAEDEEFLEEEEEEDPAQASTNRTSPIVEEEHPPPTAEQIYQASLWPYRYLGMHCKIEDALDYDDRIYPRASSRLGPRHQATVAPWPGRTVEYVKPLEIKKSGRKDGRHSKEIQALIEKDKREREQRPKWVQDEPFPGYVPRGEDLPEDDPNCTSKCLWKPAEDERNEPLKDSDGDLIISEAGIDDYMDGARTMTKQLGLPDRCTNLEDVARDLLYKNHYDAEKSLQELAKVDRSVFKEPELSAAEQKKFEEAVGKFGSELQSVKKYVKTVPHKWIVRYYYKWKKTSQGKKIWGNYSHRKGKKEIKRAQAEASKAADEVADDHDDSAFDTEKAKDKKKQFMCKFCNTKHSRQWRRAPGVTSAVVTETGSKSKDKGAQYVVALCRRCAELWRRYAIQWEDLEEVARKVAAAGGRAWKRKIDEELLKELQAANDRMKLTKYSTPEPPVAPPHAATTTQNQSTVQEPPRKKLKSERDSEPVASDAGSVGGAAAVAASKKKEKEKGQEKEKEKPHYKCVLCTVESTEHDFVEPPKISHKKKTEKERERERLEKEMAVKAADFYRKRQEDLGRPVNPREPLKRTADNNWVHVTCAVFHPEVRFGNAKALEPSEGIPSIPRSAYQEICKACGKQGGACVACHNPNCRVKVHVECAYQHGYTLGFDITPVKGSRRDQHSIVSIGGESGTMTAAVWCKDHVPKTSIHRVQDVVDESGINALQLYVRNFKQADLTLTGCARKAYLIPAAARTTSTAAVTTPANRRTSTTTIPATASPVQVNGAPREELPEIMQPEGKICCTCGTYVSPKWHPIDESQGRLLVNGHLGNLGEEAQKFVAQRRYQCHKCKKSGRRVEAPVKEETTPPPITEIS
ncbi:putative PHD type zinc finger protein with BAH domain-containing protein, partial [Cytospora paraplurivora]